MLKVLSETRRSRRSLLLKRYQPSSQTPRGGALKWLI